MEAKKPSKVFELSWIVRNPQNNREFKQNLSDIEYYFRGTCNIDSAQYWKSFVNNVGITRILKLVTLSNHKWTGFAAVKDGYRCFPDPKRKGYSVCSYGHNAWYVELICADNIDGLGGRGSEMIQEVMKSAIEHKQDYVCLSALPYVVAWYHRQGFRLTFDVDCMEPGDLRELAEDIRRQKTKFANDNDAFSNPEFVQFLRKAVTHGLGANRMQYKNQMTGCDDMNPELCAVDGVYMMVCLKDQTYEFLQQSDASISYPAEDVPSFLPDFLKASKTSEIPQEEFSLDAFWKDFKK